VVRQLNLGNRMRIGVVAVAVVVIILLVTTAYLCIYAFQKIHHALDRYRESSRFGLLVQALAHLAMSALYLLIAIIMMLFTGILVYLIIALLQTETN
jgi:hypothetical protein